MPESRAHPPRVVFVSHVAQCSGAERSLLSLLRCLPRGEVEPFAVVPSGPLSERLGALGIPVTPLPARRLRRTVNPLALVAQLRWLRQVRRVVAETCRRVGASLVHANTLPAAVALAQRGPSLPPLIWHCRDLLHPPQVLRWLASRCAAVIAISRVVERTLLEGCPQARVRVIYNGLDPSDVPLRRDRAAVRAEFGVGPETPVVISVGQLVPWKRHDLLLEAARRLAQDLPAARWWIVGADLFGDNAAYARRLQRSAPATVTFTGHREDAPDLIHAADVLLHAATAEPLGRVILEAMFLGTPCVAPAAGGIPELLESGVSGWLVEPGSAAALAQGALRLLQDAPLRARLSAAAQARVREHFSAERAAAETLALYRQIVAGGEDASGL